MPLLQETARLWAELFDRKDHGFLIQEILGRLWPRCLRIPLVIDEGYVKDLVLLKMIFDIQRSRVRHNPPKDFVLSVGELLDCLDCLDRVATAVSGSRGIAMTVRQNLLNLVQQSIFSCVRACSLSIGPPGRLTQTGRSAQIVRLETRTKNWRSDGLSDCGRHWTSAVLQGTTEDLLEIKTVDSTCDEHAPLDIPDREGFALTFDMTRCVPQAITCIAQECKYSYRSALMLLDLRLMIVAACYQHVNESLNCGTPSISSGLTPGYSESVTSSEEVRTILDKWNLLGTQLHNAAETNISNEHQSLSTFLEFVDEIDPGPPFRDSSADKILTWTGPDLTTTILSGIVNIPSSLFSIICLDLRLRSSSIVDMSGPLGHAFDHLTHQIRTWIPRRADVSQTVSNSDASIVDGHVVYVLDCSELHPIDYDMLAACLTACTDPNGEQALETGEEVINTFFRCPFQHSDESFVQKARRITPLSEIYKTLQRLVNYDAAASEPDDIGGAVPGVLSHEPAETFTQSTLSTAGSSNNHDSPTRSGSSNNRDSLVHPTFSPSAPPLVVPTPSLHASTTGWGSVVKSRALSFHSKRTKPLLHKQSKSETTQYTPDLRHSLSLDASNLIVWSGNMIRRRQLHVDNTNWSQEQVLDNIIDAATGPTHFATVSRATGGFQVSLFDASGTPAGQSMMQLDKCPTSLSFSYDGAKLAIGTATELRIISTTRTDWAGSYLRCSLVPRSKGKESGRSLPDKTRGNDWNRHKPRSQALSFSPDRRQVIVATQYNDDEGSVLIWLIEIRDGMNGGLSRLVLFESEIRVGPSDTGLTAVPCFHGSGRTTYVVCAITAHKVLPRIESIIARSHGGDGPGEADAKQITAPAFAIDRVQTAISIPGTDPRFIFVNEAAEIYFVRPSDSGKNWKAERILLPQITSHLNQDGRRRQVAIAAPSANELAIFYISHGQGHIIRYHASKPSQREPEVVSLDIFRPQIMTIGDKIT